MINNIQLLIYVLFVLAGILLAIFSVPISTWMAENKVLFFSPKKGRIVARVRAGRIIGYYGNIFDQDKYVDVKSGEVKSIYELDEKGKAKEPKTETKEFEKIIKPELENNWLWQRLGVLWLGMDNLFKYFFSENVEAESVYLKNVIPLTIKRILTLEMAEVDLDVVFDLETVNAAFSLNYENGAWMKKIIAAIESTVRESFSHLTYVQVVAGKVELSEKKSGDPFKLLDNIRALNDPSLGNDMGAVGQKITGFHVTKLVVEEEIEEISKAPAIAKGNALAAIEEAEGEAKSIGIVAKATADAITLEGNSRNAILLKTKEIVGKERAADIEISEIHKEEAVNTASKWAHSLEKTRVGAVSFGGGMGIISDNKSRSTEEKKKKEKTDKEK